MVYICGLIVILIMGHSKRGNKSNNIFMAVSSVICFLIMGLRSSSVGTDSAMYLRLYNLEMAGYSTALTDKAPLFVIVLKIVSGIFPPSDQLYFLITAVVIIGFTWLAIRISRVPCRWAVLLYYLLFLLDSLNGTRTYVAIAMELFAISLVLTRNKTNIVIGFLVSVLATFVHNIAVVGFIIMFILLLDLRKKSARKAVIFSMAVLCLFTKPAINIFTKFFPVYADTIANVHDHVGASAIVLQLIFLFSFIYSLYCISIKNDIKTEIGKRNFDNLTVILAIELFLFLVAGNFWYVQRILIFFEAPIIFLFPSSIEQKSKYRKIFRLFVWFVAFFLFAYRILRNLGSVSPYLFFWE